MIYVIVKENTRSVKYLTGRVHTAFAKIEEGIYMTAQAERGVKETEASESKFWAGLSDWATDLIGSTAAASLVREAYEQNDPLIALHGINDILNITIADAERDVAV